MINTPEIRYSLGRIKEVLDPDTYEAIVEIPGVTERRAIPRSRAILDEPKAEDLVLILDMDPLLGSVTFYELVKETDYIGIRARGKQIRFHKDFLEIGIFSEKQEAKATEAPYQEWGSTDRADRTGVSPVNTSWVRIDSEGNLDAYMEGNRSVRIDGTSDVSIGGATSVCIEGDTTVEIQGETTVVIDKKTGIKITGDTTINIDGKASVEVTGDTTLKAPKVSITGGILETPNGGTCAPKGPGQGGFCGIPVCPFTGAPHVGNQITGT